MELHERIQDLRSRRGWSQQTVAELIGVKRGTYANYEIGHRLPDADMLSRLSNVFSVSIDYLVTGSESQVPERFSRLVVLARKLNVEQLTNLETFLSSMTVDLAANE